jgi:hypothetical protein
MREHLSRLALTFSGEAFHFRTGRVVMLKVINLVLAALAVLTISPPAHAAPASQAGCSWYYADTLAMTAEYNSYADRPMAWSVQYIPPHVGGDRDFSGNGPRVAVDVAMFIASEGIGAQVTMNAVETKKDWTTVSGKSGDLWFLHLRQGWKLRTIGEVGYSYGQPYVIPGSKIAVPQGRLWDTALKVEYLDHNHAAEIFPPNINGQTISKVEVVGDTRGDEAGTETGVRVHTRVSAYELCPG